MTTPHSSFHARWSKPLLYHRCSAPYSISWPSNPLVPRAAWRWMNWLLRYTLPPWLAAMPQLPEYLAVLLFPLKSLSVAIWASLLPKPTHTYLEKIFLVTATLLDQLHLFGGWGCISNSWRVFWQSLSSSTQCFKAVLSLLPQAPWATSSVAQTILQNTIKIQIYDHATYLVPYLGNSHISDKQIHRYIFGPRHFLIHNSARHHKTLVKIRN